VALTVGEFTLSIEVIATLFAWITTVVHAFPVT